MGILDGCFSACSTKGLPRNEEVVVKKLDEEEEEEDDDDDDDEVDDREFEKRLKAMQPKLGNARASVSAEAYGKWNQKTEYKPPVYPKSDQVKARIVACLNRSFLFKSLDDQSKEVVCLAFKEHKMTKGTVIIKQGANVTADEPGLYMLESGEIAAYKNTSVTSTGKPSAQEHRKIAAKSSITTSIDDLGPKVYTYKNSGESFGELALLYNAPRAASVKAETDAQLWSINRGTFNSTVKEAAARKRDGHRNFLKSVDILKNLETFEIDKISDAVVDMKFKSGDKIIREGDIGKEFFMLDEGTAEAKKGNFTVMSYKQGQSFGELALLKRAPRAASIVATSNCNVLMLEEEAFRRLLGPLEERMKSRAKTLYDVSVE